jgi:hypothetical protein
LWPSSGSAVAPPPAGDFADIIGTLRRHRVRFVLVGGVAAVIEGAPVTTFDLDIVHERTRQNVRRLRAALEELGAHYRIRRDVRLVPTADALAGSGHHLLLTRHGPLDVLGMVGNGRDFRALAGHSRRRKLAGRFVLVLDLPTQIAIKHEVGHRKDLAVLPLLEEVLRAQRRRRPRRSPGRRP